MTIKSGFIFYSNCFPVYYPFWKGALPHPGIKLVEARPAELNRLCAKGKLDISAVSSIEYARLKDKYLIIDGISLNSFGYVKSVLLVSRVKIENLDKKRIGLTSYSATSHCLLKIILRDHYRISPEYAVTDKFGSEMEAFLLIGDEALNFTGKRGFYIYDLGRLWAEIYRLPAIFALWLVNKRSATKHKKEISDFSRSLKRSYGYTKEHWKEFISAAKTRYPRLNTDMEEYYGNLRFDFGAEKKKAFLFFLKKAAEFSLCPPCGSLEYYEP